LANAENVRDMLLRRAQRASECVWIDQCRIALRSGATAQYPTFSQLADPDTAVGEPGDLVALPPNELMRAWSSADAAWAGASRGILALSAHRIVNASGEPIARGAAIRGLFTMPWLAVSDPSRLCQTNSRQLAHEMGHVFALPHRADDTALMANTSEGLQLSRAECQVTREHVATNLGLLEPSLIGEETGFFDRATDQLGEAPAGLEYLDLLNSIVLETAASEDKLLFFVGLAGVIPLTGPQGEVDAVYIALVLDRDNDLSTGDNASLVVPDLDFPGADFIIEILVDRKSGKAVPNLKKATGRGVFLEIEVLEDLLKAEAVIGELELCGPTPAYDGPDALPVSTEVRVEIARDVIVPSVADTNVSEGSRVFPQGLRFQTATALREGQSPVDRSPEVPVVLRFGESAWPTVFAQRRVSPGEPLKVKVARMPPSMPLLAWIGAFEATHPRVVTDKQGAAEFELSVPADAQLGATLLTVRIDDALTALTGDAIVEITPCPPDLDGDGSLTIFDFLTFQNSWQTGEEVADYDGDHDLTIFDFTSYQQAFEEGCP
jgi:hypothetical protein